MGDTDRPYDRATAMSIVSDFVKFYVTIEPIMDFNLNELVKIIRYCKPVQVNIGADTGHNKLHEPTAYKVNQLIMGLSSFTNVVIKPNLNRIIKE